MKKILLACAMGMSTSLLVTKMKEAAKKRDEKYQIWATDVDSIEDEEEFDIVLLGPQVSHRLREAKEEINNPKIPVLVIDKMDYGSCNGEAVLNFAENALKR